MQQPDHAQREEDQGPAPLTSAWSTGDPQVAPGRRRFLGHQCSAVAPPPASEINGPANAAKSTPRAAAVHAAARATRGVVLTANGASPLSSPYITASQRTNQKSAR